MTRDEYLMLRCINLAKQGAGYVSPNPLVGCVIVKDSKIIAEDYHKKFGMPHAEANAIDAALTKGINLKGSSIYVNLEPCSHYGNTPPCVDKIIENKFSKVVIGIKDPNPLVSGRSIKKLKRSGKEVTLGVLEKECKALNKFFLKYITTGLPHITLKAAQTMDGKIARENYESKWITSLESRELVHKMRSEYDAVLVGRKTVKYDDPELTVRHVKGRNPFRIVIDANLSLKTNYKLFTDSESNKTIVLTGKIKNKRKAVLLEKNFVKIIECKTKNAIIDLHDALKQIGKLGISSIMVEGGSETYSHFLKQDMVDEIMIFVSPKVFGDGIQIFKNDFDFSKNIRSVEKIGNDVLFKFQLKEY
ncbi:MAG TPA: bifunctional diaminohydroxyphosphoribosylaminopyrimidine deaminase/5-amino-6-(5-phosphoribosylamino)uracil reductase RibD [Ignavibacteria bacterium]|jgi:diaminohydroxyphosphoribosylaminopyrimidine deaminase/5-amino-6-(5-phosphoribosylamino)uracil reductase